MENSGRDSASLSPYPYIEGTWEHEESVLGQRPVAVRLSGMPYPKARRYVVQGLIPEGHSAVIYGEGGSAKSFLALSAGMSVARGDSEWLDNRVRQVPVLYVDFELDVEEQVRRAYQLARGLGLEKPPDDLFYLPALGCSSSEVFDAAFEACREYGAKLMVVDSVGVAIEGDSESAKDVIGFYRAMNRFRAKGVAVLLVDHQSKYQQGQDYRAKTAFGSVYKHNMARSVIQVEPRKHEGNVLAVALHQTKHNFGPRYASFGAKLTFSDQEVTVETVELDARDSSNERKPTAMEKVRRELENGPTYPEELAVETGLARRRSRTNSPRYVRKVRSSTRERGGGRRGRFG